MTTKGLPTTRLTLHRPNLRMRADLYDIIPKCAPLHDLPRFPLGPHL
jgi:hypothetical protein